MGKPKKQSQYQTHFQGPTVVILLLNCVLYAKIFVLPLYWWVYIYRCLEIFEDRGKTVLKIKNKKRKHWYNSFFLVYMAGKITQLLEDLFIYNIWWQNALKKCSLKFTQTSIRIYCKLPLTSYHITGIILTCPLVSNEARVLFFQNLLFF